MMRPQVVALALAAVVLIGSPLSAQRTVTPFASINDGGTFGIGTSIEVPMANLQVSGRAVTIVPGATYYLGNGGTALGFDADAMVNLDREGRLLYVGAGVHLNYSSVSVAGFGSTSATSLGLNAFVGTDLGALGQRATKNRMSRSPTRAAPSRSWARSTSVRKKSRS